MLARMGERCFRQFTIDCPRHRDAPALLEARRKDLADMMARWEPDILNRMVDTLVRDLPEPFPGPE
jgi:hypothetical protein